MWGAKSVDWQSFRDPFTSCSSLSFSHLKRKKRCWSIKLHLPCIVISSYWNKHFRLHIIYTLWEKPRVGDVSESVWLHACLKETLFPHDDPFFNILCVDPGWTQPPDPFLVPVPGSCPHAAVHPPGYSWPVNSALPLRNGYRPLEQRLHRK